VSSTTISLIVFGCVFAGALVGIVLRALLPDRQFSHQTRDVLGLALGLVTTMTALVLGLLISTAKSSYDAKRNELAQVSVDVILLDRSLALYGSETSKARSALRDFVTDLVDQSQSSGEPSAKLVPGSKKEATDFYRMVRRLSPRDDGQKSLKAEALRISFEVGQIRASVLARERSSVPRPFLLILVLWLAVLFAGFGLSAPRILAVVVVLGVCALIVSTAFFLILEMDQPTGIMKLSLEPLRNAIAVIDSPDTEGNP